MILKKLKDQKNLLISTKGLTKIYDLQNDILLETEEVNYDRKNKILISEKKSILKDNMDNQIITNFFHFDVDKSILK